MLMHHHHDNKGINLLSNQVIKLNISGRYDMNDVLQVFNYNITSTDDPEFSFPQFPGKIGRHFFVRDFPDYSTNPMLKNEIFLVLSKKLKNNKFRNLQTMYLLTI